MGGWFKTIDNENFEFWECAMCNNVNHNYIVVKKGIIEDKRVKRISRLTKKSESTLDDFGLKM